MAEADNRDCDKSLVLSIFKGENFVVKGGTVYRALLRARCADLDPELGLETGRVKLSPGNPELEFNSQLAWSLSRKQLKDLRSNRSIIRVCCVAVDEKDGPEIEIGYVILHVKDATTFETGDVDPSKAKTLPLLGTRDPWRSVQPKLQMILHLEDRVVRSRRRQENDTKFSTQNFQTETGPSKLEHDEKSPKNATKLSETKLLPNRDPEKFTWLVNEEEGYFQLGEPAEADDLYVLNTTVISASYLHLLWDGRSPRKRNPDNYFWQIKYTAYGCEIASEPFLLAHDDESRRTFIGDKATARIRTNGARFFEYLEETNLQFRLLRYQVGSNGELTNDEVMGLCFASLSELTDPNKSEHRVSLEVVSEWGTPRVISTHERPEVRVIFTLDTVPEYFSLCRPQNGVSSQKVGPRDEAVNESDLHQAKPEILISTESKNSVGEVEKQNGKGGGTSEEKHSIFGSPERAHENTDAIDSKDARRLLQFENGNHKNRENRSLSSSSSMLESPENLKVDNTKRKTYKRDKPREFVRHSHSLSDSEESDYTSNKENLLRILPQPGEYKVTIELTRFWLKSKKLIREHFMLSYLHPPAGISHNHVKCYAEPLSPEFTESRQGFLIMDGEYTTAFRVTKISESLVNEPLTVDFRKINSNSTSDSFANALIPFGRIFSQKGHQQVWILEDVVDILKIPSNVKIGMLYFKILLSRDDINSPLSGERRSPKQSAFFPPLNSDEHDGKIKRDIKCSRDSEKAAKVTEDMREWRRTQEEIYKRQKEEKEAAYLKLLSEEAAKRDAERENVMSKKLTDLERKEKELNRQRKQLEDREAQLKHLEMEVKDNARQLALDQESLQQSMKLQVKRLEENHKIEMDSLARKFQSYQEDAEKLKTKVVLLEKKLETKEAEIDNLLATKREQPDSRLLERLKLSEQENKTLKTELREANAKKEQYKKQSYALCQKLSRIQQERDQDLKDQNENLRLQILASKEHKELKKERKAVQGLSDTLKALKKETVPSKPHDGKGDQADAPHEHFRKSGSKPTNEDEIQRLTEERSKLLGSGAYTQFDMVIKELEKKIVTLARQ